MPRVRDDEGHSMRRKLFTFFSALSLLLCLAVCVMWVRGPSYRLQLYPFVSISEFNPTWRGYALSPGFYVEWGGITQVASYWFLFVHTLVAPIWWLNDRLKHMRRRAT